MTYPVPNQALKSDPPSSRDLAQTLFGSLHRHLVESGASVLDVAKKWGVDPKLARQLIQGHGPGQGIQDIAEKQSLERLVDVAIRLGLKVQSTVSEGKV